MYNDECLAQLIHKGLEFLARGGLRREQRRMYVMYGFGCSCSVMFCTPQVAVRPYGELNSGFSKTEGLQRCSYRYVCFAVYQYSSLRTRNSIVRGNTHGTYRTFSDPIWKMVFRKALGFQSNPNECVAVVQTVRSSSHD